MTFDLDICHAGSRKVKFISQEFTAT